MIDIDVMSTRALFLIEMVEPQIEHLHKFERSIGRRQVGGEIARSEYASRETTFQSGINVTESNTEWRRFEDDIKNLRPHFNEEWQTLDYIHAWDWNIHHHIKRFNYDFYKWEKKKKKKMGIF